MKVRILSELKHDQNVYEIGDVVELDDEVAEKLIKLGVVKQSTKEDELVAEARAKAKAEEAQEEAKKSKVRK